MAEAGPQRIVGIDFSGAADAGRLIWIAEGWRQGTALHLLFCMPACELPGGAVEREPAFRAVVAYLAGLGEAAVGIDAPFGLPEALFIASDWLEFVGRCARDWPDPDSFRRACCAAQPDRELRRETDREAGTPFAPYNLRLYRQTWHAIAGVLAPLVLTGRAVAVPMQPPAPGVPMLMEVCPASFLKRRTDGLYRPYKGHGDSRRAQREAILGALVERGWLHAPPVETERRILENAGGDALDAVIAAAVALRESADPANLRPRSGWERRDRIEARVYF